MTLIQRRGGGAHLHLHAKRRHNAANHPPAHPRLIRESLPRVGCIGLFGGDPTLMRRGAISSRSSIRASAKTTALRHHVIRLQRDAERRDSYGAQRSRPTREHYRARFARGNCFFREAQRARQAKTKSFKWRPPQAAERPASPAAHSTHQPRRLADESRATRGRVHAVVRQRV